MKQNYTNTMKQLIILIVLLIGTTNYAQNIEFSFLNAENTNDGADDFYEVDIMIRTIDGQADFKLGSGQLYINYNTAAFGMNIDASGNSTITAIFGDGYFLGEASGFTNFYNVGDGIDNTSSTISWSFTQGVSSGAMTELVTATARRLFHLKIKYADVGELPDVMFNTAIVASTDQFFTACGPYDSPSTTLDCDPSEPLNDNIQFVGATFNSAEATLSDNGFELLTEQFSMYPNPASDMVYIKGNITDLKQIDIFNINGQLVKTVTNNLDRIDVSNLESAVYFVKLYSNTGSKTMKLVKK